MLIMQLFSVALYLEHLKLNIPRRTGISVTACQQFHFQELMLWRKDSKLQADL
jgi:hypothetical protein